MKNKITIIGSGAFATAMGLVLTDSKNKDIVIYGINKEELLELNKGLNTKYFPESVDLPKFKTSSNLKDALKDAKYIFLAIPSKIIDIVFPEILKSLNSEVIIINGIKGFYPNSNLLIHSGLKKVSKNNNYVKGIVSIVGPSHAEEIVLKYPTLVTIVGKKMKINKEVYNLFRTKYFKTYIQKDIIGAEVGATYKNILAIASGLSTGLGYGVNSRAAIISRGLLEMARFNKMMNGKFMTIYGLSGLGDLVVTATSDLSRNFRYGKRLAKIKNRKDATLTVEGLTALEYVYKIGKKNDLNLPIAYALYNIIFNNKNINKEIEKIWESNKIFE